MILSKKDIADIANDQNQTKLVRYLAKRCDNMHAVIAQLSERNDTLAGALAHISSAAKKKLNEAKHPFAFPREFPNED